MKEFLQTLRRKRRTGKGKILTAILALVLAAAAVGAVVVAVQRLPLRRTPGAKVDVPDWVEPAMLPVNEFSRPAEPLQEVNAVVIHYVGNPNTSARANRNYFAGLAVTRATYASSHFIVGLEGEILQCVPLSEISYCSNKRNADTIAIEVCHPDESGVFSPETMESVTKLTAWLCSEFSLTASDVIRHYDVSGKICPKYYVENEEAWLDLLAGVDAAIPAFAQ